MISNFVVDQKATFVAPPQFLMCEPKVDRDGARVRVKNTGQFQVTVHVLALQKNQFGQVAFEPLKVTLLTATAEANPCDGIAPNAPVELEHFEIGVMEKTRKVNGEDKVIGVNVWYRAASIRPVPVAASGAK